MPESFKSPFVRIRQPVQHTRAQHDARNNQRSSSPAHSMPKGGLSAGDVRVREAALLGTNEYAQQDWLRTYEPLTPHTEFAYGCHVEGSIPPDLDGTLFRNGPGKYERGGIAYEHILDGDGLVISIELDPVSNKAFAQGRFVRTAEFLEEEEAGKILYRGTFGTRKPGGLLRNAFDLRTKNLANTNAVFWGGRLHALYEAGVPYEIDPSSLMTRCVDDMEGCLPRIEGLFVSTSVDALDQVSGLGGWAFTAHPHIDPHMAQLCGWAWQSNAATNSLRLRFTEWNEDWDVTASREYDLKDCETAPHDFGVTASKYVMIQNRLDIDKGSYVLGLKAAANALISRPDLPVLVHVIPRAKDAPAMVFEGPQQSFEIHTCLAHDGPPIGSVSNLDTNANTVTVYTAGWDRLAQGSFLSEWGSEVDLAPDFNNIPRTVLWRYVIDTKSGNVTRTMAPGSEDLCLDHPHVNPRFEGSAACRYVFASISNEVSTSGPPRGYVRLDLLTGVREVWYAPSGRVFVEEPVIVEKAAAGGNAEDTGDVWLLGMSTDMDKNSQSSLLVLDGARLADGPVCRIHLDHHITHGLHGWFAQGFHAGKGAG
eukprot:gnl/MRDRNA2_/MRDRNA2_195288_c0_seq1.p1 gnl/MRDRNA2_/MRDRNA2_195288_c0~~gnl/MRDRNA2_/MRDRNA2_195288_c0_seq1.p1  ORF type:complete len:612 (+),score=90.42 gnl/MRDRNA2_/MRDRNA2_195288_c0_seq1:56-1837(+)